MQKFKVLLVAIALCSFVFGACNNCITCTYGSGANVVTTETCGTQEERDAAEVVANVNAVIAGTTAECK